MALDPLTLKKIRRFKSIKRGYLSFLILCVLVALSLCAELFVNSKALLVKYEGNLHVPLMSDMIPGTTFGFDYEYETNYRDLKKKVDAEGKGDFVIMPLVPYNPYENDLEKNPPSAPSLDDRHFLGTDTSGRDVVARIVYGFRIAIIFAVCLAICEYIVGITIGCVMGYYGGRFDLIVQRLIEIWSNIPTLYIVIIIASFITPNFWTLISILIAFGWMRQTSYMRAFMYKEKAADYVLAARSVGMSDRRIIFSQILPNILSIIITFLPFTVESAIVGLSIYDYLGFGLPPPTPSWGELLRQGTTNLRNASWISISVVTCMALLLTMITFVGEALREAFDPKKHTTYE
jgi:microcin C transport system permease protein